MARGTVEDQIPKHYQEMLGQHGHIVRMGKREYYTNDHRIPTNKEHYFPTFLAKDREELGANQAARRALKEYSIMFPANLEVEEEPA